MKSTFASIRSIDAAFDIDIYEFSYPYDVYVNNVLCAYLRPLSSLSQKIEFDDIIKMLFPCHGMGLYKFVDKFSTHFARIDSSGLILAKCYHFYNSSVIFYFTDKQLHYLTYSIETGTLHINYYKKDGINGNIIYHSDSVQYINGKDDLPLNDSREYYAAMYNELCGLVGLEELCVA
jgi:hypothetical protein